MVAQRIVDFLEAVEIEKQHGKRFFLAPGEVQFMFEAIVEQGPVGQARQGVVHRLVLKLLLIGLALGDVAHDADIHLFVIELHFADRQLKRKVSAILAPPAELARPRIDA